MTKHNLNELFKTNKRKLRSGVNVRVIAELASHKSIQTTQRYIDINDKLCSKAIES
jgi:site-specific recombinase XerD